MTRAEISEMIVTAISAAEQGETQAALPILENLIRHDTRPAVCSYLAYCSAVERGDLANAVMLCRQMIQDDPENPIHFLNLGRIYRHHGRQSAALNAFREGLKLRPHQGLQQALAEMGVRQNPVLPWLSRDHLANKLLGKMRSRYRHATVKPMTVVPDPEEV